MNHLHWIHAAGDPLARHQGRKVGRSWLRFPVDFMFQLTSKENAEVVAICDHLGKLKFSHAKPFAFTEHGAMMVASVLNSKRAIEVSVYVVRAFVNVREVLWAHSELEAWRRGPAGLLN